MELSMSKELLEGKRKTLPGTLGGPVQPGPAAPRRSSRGISARRIVAAPLAETAPVCVEELRAIDVALARLREGSYGYCQICGSDISSEWLRESPSSPFCYSCSQ
ncbi:TraR/DksA family transcriptional regulator [Cribrihabitans pelagius]|uniref:TraR/DksA family transcriptional regulator n=1 Tax=Cribrihabitans pelagius TaxID=1765746 RepID=UPI003B5CAE21